VSPGVSPPFYRTFCLLNFVRPFSLPCSFARLLAAHPGLDQTPLSCEDVDHFIGLCKFQGKPVNFVPVVDSELAFW
jgi:hypothetical protein